MSPARKNKITLSDYDYQRDIENRLLMAQFSTLDLEITEEILFSSLSSPIHKLAKNLDLDEKILHPTLEKLSQAGVIKIQNETILVDKEMRKYYESQIVKFDDQFTPGMEFLQNLLRKAPIHVLPTWYSIPRTSNNIFDSLIEKYLLTPQIFQRYLLELNFGDPVLSGIINDVFHASDFKVTAQELIEKYKLARAQFEEYMLHLEFSFVCCLGYNRSGDCWIEVVTPFYEWREYVRFVRDTQPSPIQNFSAIKRQRPHDFSFVEEMGTLLQAIKKEPLPQSAFQEDQVLAKLRLLKLVDVVDGRLYALEVANDWLDMRPENRALYLYRHPLNRLLTVDLPPTLCQEKNIREAEKSIQRVLHAGWVYFDDFLKGVTSALSEESIVMLRRVGKTWKYNLPHYTEEEKALIQAALFEGLFEAGVIATGAHDGRECFCVTPFGQSLFGR